MSGKIEHRVAVGFQGPADHTRRQREIKTVDADDALPVKIAARSDDVALDAREIIDLLREVKAVGQTLVYHLELITGTDSTEFENGSD